MLFLCSGALSGGHGHSLPLSLRADHQENKFPSFGNELTALFCSNQRDGGKRLIQGVIRHESYTDPKQKNGTMAMKWQCNDWVRTKI
jgi:hypothetical protein